MSLRLFSLIMMFFAATSMFMVAGCAPSANSQRHANWDQITSAPNVAKVNNIKSLISPVFY